MNGLVVINLGCVAIHLAGYVASGNSVSFYGALFNLAVAGFCYDSSK
jgi:hypothetical protein